MIDGIRLKYLTAPSPHTGLSVYSPQPGEDEWQLSALLGEALMYRE
ncbi:hypothetical protein [Streptomyces hirsutus]